VTDKNGEVAGKFDYEAYGNVIGSDGLNIDKVALKNVPNVFVGAYGIRYDTKTDLSYMRFRWYSPETMRFVSPDRLMGVNRYGYVAGNPLKLIDVFGAQEQALYPVGTFVNNQYQPFPYYYRPNFYAYGPANLSQSDFHPGIDLPGNANSAIIAMYSGVVIKIEPYSNENLKQYTVSIKRTYKDNCGRIHNMIVEYVHVGLLSLNIYEGARINQGESIGLLYPYRGDLYHLHLQIFLDSGYVDPAPYINIVNNPEYQMTVQAQQLDYYNTHINKRGLNIFSRQ
jgi:RHS repeat-associated protein